MCIALVTTAHPKYALIVIDNRDEYVLRPTSRPYWWTHRPSGHKVLSARDLHRRERGTWLGMGADGRFAVLTNYRESSDDDPEHPISGVRSRGGMVTAWLGSPPEERLDDFVHRMLESRMVKGVGGFSLICGDLRRRTEDGIEPLAIISNRSDHPDMVPRIGGERGKTYGLSNGIYVDPPQWPKIKKGKKLLEETIREAVDKDLDESSLTEKLFSVLDDDTLPLSANMTFLDFMDSLRESVFIPAFSDDEVKKDMAEAVQSGKAKAAFDEIEDDSEVEDRPEAAQMFMKGGYGTQRQTILLCDWDGNVVYKERALWDQHGNQIERGKGDVEHRFKVPTLDE
ncbi:hypothetical protein MGN70_000263 [Eutypa lata]|uniref:Putative duf833 domain-containing protein n=1 Tax=Eutypa lata (strain UCR-EL1) TaxID=1287681 RepID=M7SQ55_EUTLA|nr:putative duf833 domain-containing protein [Eutypa lata UCREL1]KAI1257224.1 hypothetical protein MGN70_000263 [Eutypa lata]